MSKKESAVSFLAMASSGETKDAFDKFVAPDFIHHNQYFKGDRQSLMAAMDDAHNKSPNKLIDVKQVFEDGDTVITHSLVVRENPDAQDVAVVHIFKFKNDKVVELWDIGMLLEKHSPNENGAF